MKIGSQNIWIHAIRGITAMVSLYLVFQIVSAFTNESARELKEGVPSKYSVYAVEMPDKMDFAGEVVQTQYFDVYEAIDREFLNTMYGQANLLLALKRANRYFPVVEPILKAEGIPDDFKYLMVIESMMLNATSSAGAKGFWQFMERTAGSYNLEINDEVDERYHLEKATLAACKFLNWVYSRTQSWTITAAAYNMGRAGVINQLARQRTDDYWELWLNNETSRYVPKIIAMKYILQKPETYGFHFKKHQLYAPWPVREIEVSTSIASLPDWAIEQGMSFKMLKYLNPWLKTRKLSNKKGKTYVIKVFEKGYREIHKNAKAFQDDPTENTADE
jgi:hypothetical protein